MEESLETQLGKLTKEIQKFGSHHDKLQEKREELADKGKTMELMACDEDIQKMSEWLQALWAQNDQ